MAQDQQQEQINQGAQYQAFKEAGGSLSEKDYETTARLIKLISKRPPIEDLLIKSARESTLNLFEIEAEKCKKLGITISPKQKAVYCFLRRRKESNPQPTVRAGGLSDQETVADIILMTGTVKDYDTYLRHYPAIAKRRFPK